jgi:imidazolonepropionase
MTSLLIDNIGSLVTNAPELGAGPLGLLNDAALIAKDGVVVWVGPRSAASPADARVDAGGRAVIPGFVDSHAHLVFAGDRTAEFTARMSGQPYTAGGIRGTVTATRAASADQLRTTVAGLVREALRSGTTTMECKSGYGLTIESELRSLKVAAEVTDEVTFLGAHVVPPEYADRPDDYVHLVCTEMLDACGPAAKWVDVFCERGAFDADQTRAILTAGIDRGLQPRVHANQLGPGPGVQIAVEFGAASADHATHLDDADVAALAGSQTVATLLPGAESPRAQPIRTRGGCSTPASPSPCRPTAIPAPASPPACRSASPWPYATCI